MPKIVLSYRRADSAGITRLIFERLTGHFGKESVFMDVDIPYGIDFRKHINEMLADCDILVAIVGPKWLGPRRFWQPPRINEESDPVRVEIEAALKRDLP